MNWARGVSVSDLRSISNVEGLAKTNVAGNLLTLAALEYLRGVAIPRVEKHWYADEACLQLQATPADTRISAGGTTMVTARPRRRPAKARLWPWLPRVAETIPFIAPRLRVRRTRARVSTPSIPTTPCSAR